jgi:DNA-binding transcriptional MocR family regulator
VAKRSASLPNIVINVDCSSRHPLYQQIYNEVRGGILNGQLVPGTRLPSTRELAAELGLSRTTVLMLLISSFQKATSRVTLARALSSLALFRKNRYKFGPREATLQNQYPRGAPFHGGERNLL